MKKLPVVKTIVEAYQFAFGHLGATIGLIWLPLVLVTLLNFLPELGDGGGANAPMAAGSNALEGLAIVVLTQLLYAIIYVAVTRQALGLRKGAAVVHFALGLPEFRMFGASLLFVLASLGCLIFFAMLLVAVAGLVAAEGANPAIILMGGVAVLAAGIAAAYALLRLGFLLIPVTTIENRVDLSRGWALTRGNFWRIVAVLVAISAPILAVEVATVLTLMGKDLIAALPPFTSSQAVIQQHLTMLEEVFRRHTPELLGLTLILAPFNLGLSISASAFGYRALVPEGEIRA